MNNLLNKLIFAAVILTFSLNAAAQQKNSHRFEVSRYLDYFNLVYRYIDLNYVDSVAPEKAIKTGIDAMLKSLDPYTEFYSEDEASDLSVMLTGNYAGVGSLIVLYKGKQVCFSEPYQGQPAAEAGIRAGDVILEIDGENVSGWAITKVSERLRGKEGTTVKVKVQRHGEAKPLDFTIKRRSVQLPSVPYHKLYRQGVGVICLSTFTGEPAKEFKQAFVDLKEQGMKSLIIDLRGNTGGALQAAVDILGYFLPRNTEVVVMKGRGDKKEKTFRTSGTPLDTEMPILVLVDDSSASSSEILAGALQDLDRAVVMGSPTFGKGLVQSVLPLPYGAEMKLTTAKYYIPSGRCVQRVDYAHPDSSSIILSDSLRKAYYTAAGRKVYGNSGITPDTLYKDSLDMASYGFLNTLSIDVDTLRQIFDYATAYHATHATIAAPADFEISDGDYAAFIETLKRNNFTYKRLTDRSLEQLIQTAETEGIRDEIQDAIDKIRDACRINIDRDAEQYKAQVRRMLAQEIVKRYYYTRGAYEYHLQHDPMFDRAVSFAAKPEEMRQLLK